jgi:hypothetical protein
VRVHCVLLGRQQGVNGVDHGQAHHQCAALNKWVGSRMADGLLGNTRVQVLVTNKSNG